ncbi:fumarylacetoacetate hydrolase family protein [Streptomyces sp. NPDC096132]|uniref:fumarylacetoacetate hydrolase family protein n=1 Tax=Streptomyces sp. NPDC096132 TaxID=3366075 RepID=UPI0037F4A798
MKSPAWSLAQYVTEDDPQPRACVLSSTVIRALPGGLHGQDALQLLRDWSAASEVLSQLGNELRVDELPEIPGARLSAPLTYPSKVLGAGANYLDHSAEMGAQAPKADGRAFLFLKPPTTTVIGPDTPVVMPRTSDPRLDWEVELAVVIGRGGRHIPSHLAMEHVAGYTVANDISARGDFANPDGVAPVFQFDWLAHKGQDGFCPLGPGIVPAWLVPEPHDLSLGLDVNGEPLQNSSTSNMVIRIEDLIAGASQWLTLEPGDVLLTGTPAGVGAGRDHFLRVGDVTRAWIDGIGEITNQIVETE